jgi:hypothetical protein
LHRGVGRITQMEEGELYTKNGRSSPVQGGRAATWGAALLEQMVLERITGGGGSRGDAKLAIQRGRMVVDGARTYH